MPQYKGYLRIKTRSHLVIDNLLFYYKINKKCTNKIDLNTFEPKAQNHYNTTFNY